MRNIREEDILFWAGGNVLQKYGTIVRRTRPDAPALNFSRASAGTIAGRTGTVREVAANVPRIDWSHGRPALLLEPAATNLLRDSCNLPASGSAWGTTSNFSVSAAASLFAGQTAWRHQNLGLVTSPIRSQAIGTFTGQPQTSSLIVENVDAAETALSIRDITAGVHVCLVRFTWATGQTSVQSGTGIVRAQKLADAGPNGGPVYRIIVTGTGTPGNSRSIFVYPTGTSQNTETVILHHAQHEGGPFATSPIVTTASTVTRAADVLTFPWPHAPQPMTLYVRIVETGGVLRESDSTIVRIGASPGNRVVLFNNAATDTYALRYASNGSVATLTLSVAPVRDDIVEFLIPIDEAGAYLAQSINGSDPTQTTLASLPIPTAWEPPTLTIGGGGQFDLLDFFVLRGASWTMDQIREVVGV